MRIAFDLDGVLADFAGAYEAIADRLRPRPPGSVLGLSESPSVDRPPSSRLERRVWREIRSVENFWTTLEPIEHDAVVRIHEQTIRRRWEPFFVTQRPDTAGDTVQRQTQRWLVERGFPLPAVIVHRGSRGKLAAALELDCLVDDSVEHCVDVIEMSGAGPILVRRQEDPVAETNARRLGIVVCRSVAEALKEVVHRPVGGKGPSRLFRRQAQGTGRHVRG